MTILEGSTSATREAIPAVGPEMADAADGGFTIPERLTTPGTSERRRRRIGVPRKACLRHGGRSYKTKSADKMR